MSDRRPLLRIALTLYGFALVTPALVLDGHKTLWGFHCLIWGWMVEPCWLANPLLLVAVLALAWRKQRLAAVAALTALAMGGSTLLVMADDLRYPHIGCIAWLASMLLVLIAALRPEPPAAGMPRARLRR